MWMKKVFKVRSHVTANLCVRVCREPPGLQWCMDGHEKILQAMGIAVWGINDKYAQVEIDLYAVPNARI